MLDDARPVIVIEGYGSRIRSLSGADEKAAAVAVAHLVHLTRLPERVRPINDVTIEYWDEMRPVGGNYEQLLRGMGFRGEKNQTMVFDRWT